MKKILIILFLLIPFGIYAQTDRDLLLEIAKQQAKQGEQIAELTKQMAETNKQMAETNKQVAETNKQVAVNSTDIKALDKRFDILLYFLIGGSGTLFVGIFGLIGVIVWDRRAANAPLEATTKDLKKEIDLLKEQELKHQEKEQKTDTLLKKILEKFPDLAGLA